MKFIFADSIDVVDPSYDFIADRHTPGRTPYWDDVYPHEIFDRPPYDGILVSRAIVGAGNLTGKYSESQRMRFLRVGAKEFLRIKDSEKTKFPIFGDCGSFSYAKLETPPFTPADTVEFYADGRFDYGCSIDHIIFEYLRVNGKTTEPLQISKDRFEMTLQLATEFLEESKVLGPTFTPIGVAQGWDAKSLAESARRQILMGYKYIAIGGLVPLRIAEIHEAVSAVNEVAKTYSDIKIHLLGFAKADYLKEFARYSRVASFDSTSPLIRAFKDKSHNYWMPDKDGNLKYYSAIRVPQALENNTLLRKVKSGALSIEALKRQETKALSMLRGYDQGQCTLEDALESVITYSVPLYDDGRSEKASLHKKMENLRLSYRRTLQDKPWKSCSCVICKMISIEAVIFRASNRNKRRGFHNLEIFHRHVAESLNL